MQSRYNNTEPQNLEFATYRVKFELLSEKDCAFYTSLYCDPKIMRLIGSPLNIATAKRAFMATIKSNKKPFSDNSHMKVWVAKCIESNDSLGIVSLNWSTIEFRKKDNGIEVVSPSFNEPEIGIILSRKAHGKQLAEEAITGLLSFGFEQLKIPKFHTFYQQKNIAVRRFVKKLGFVFSNILSPIDTNTTYQYITPLTFKPFSR